MKKTALYFVLGFCLGLLVMSFISHVMKPKNLPDGHYVMMFSFSAHRGKEAKQTPYEVDITNVDGTVTITKEKSKKYPIIGKIKNGVFSAQLKKPKPDGTIQLQGILINETTIKGFIRGINTSPFEILPDTFTLYKQPTKKSS